MGWLFDGLLPGHHGFWSCSVTWLCGCPATLVRKMTTRRETLQAAIDATDARGVAYDAPAANFERIARRWRAHIMNRFGVEIPLMAYRSRSCATISRALVLSMTLRGTILGSTRQAMPRAGRKSR